MLGTQPDTGNGGADGRWCPALGLTDESHSEVCMTASMDEEAGQPRASVAQVVEEFGGVEALTARMDEHERLTARLRSEIASLPEFNGDRWVAMGRDGVLEVGGSLDEVLARIEAKGLAEGAVVVEFVSPDQSVLIL